MIRLVALTLLALHVISTAARTNEGFKYEEKIWVEQEVRDLPAYPDPTALSKIPLQGENQYSYLVDHRSLAVGPDAIIRFIFAVRTEQGGTQISYAGLRCASREWKTYAYGTEQGAWRRPTNVSWEPIELKRRENYRHEMYADFLCEGGGPAGSEKALVARLRRSPAKRVR